MWCPKPSSSRLSGEAENQGPRNTQGCSSAGCSSTSDIFYDFGGHSATNCITLSFFKMSQQNTQSSTSESTAAAASSTTTLSQPSGTSQHEREVKALLQEANAMLSKLTQLQALTVTQESSDELRVAIKAYEAQVRARTALWTLEPSHAFRPLREGELDNTTPIKVELAGGQETWLRQTKAGTLVPSSHDDGATVGSIVPLGALVQQLNCTLTWSKDDGLVINHPAYGKIAAQTIGNCPVISEAQAP